MKIRFCQYCGLLLSEGCDCLNEEMKSHLHDFLLVEHASEFQMSYSEERSILEYAEHRMG